MMQRKTRLFAGAIAALFFAGTLCVPISAKASEEGRRNTALALGGLTAYLFTRGGSKVPAFVGLGATAYAYKRYQDKINDRKKRERYAIARRYYRSGYRRGYTSGRRYRRSRR
jgi:hypothetical protein